MPLKGKQTVLRKYDENAGKFVRALALEGLNRLVEKTPRDTARAANNWNVATGAPRMENIPPGQYPQGGSVALLKGEREAAGINPGDTIFLTNTLDYIQALEDGHSKQASAGMIGVTVRELQPLAGEIVRKIR